MSTNNITGDSLRTKPATQAYLDNYDLIFRKDNDMKSKSPAKKPTKKPPMKKDKC